MKLHKQRRALNLTYLAYLPNLPNLAWFALTGLSEMLYLLGCAVQRLFLPPFEAVLHSN